MLVVHALDRGGARAAGGLMPPGDGGAPDTPASLGRACAACLASTAAGGGKQRRATVNSVLARTPYTGRGKDYPQIYLASFVRFVIMIVVIKGFS